MNTLTMKYDLKGKIGSGAFSEVFLAIRKESGKQFAVKHTDKTKVNPKNYVREVEIMQAIHAAGGHPNIVHVEEILQDDHNVFIVQEYLPAGNLLLYLSQHAPLSEAHILRIFTPILSALEFLHDLKIAHRDIKLENILMTDDAVPKLIDFNLSCIWNETTVQRGFCGSQEYCAPEIFLREPYKGPEVDVWSLGVLLYALLFCEFPFKPDRSQPKGSGPQSNKTPLAQQVVRGTYTFPEHHLVSNAAIEVVKAMLQGVAAVRPSLSVVRQMAWFKKEKQPSLTDMLLSVESSKGTKDKMEDKLAEVTQEKDEGELIHEEWLKAYYAKQHAIDERPNKIQQRSNTTGRFAQSKGLWARMLRVGKSLHFN